jgi:hypothetical protein
VFKVNCYATICSRTRKVKFYKSNINSIKIALKISIFCLPSAICIFFTPRNRLNVEQSSHNSSKERRTAAAGTKPRHKFGELLINRLIEFSQMLKAKNAIQLLTRDPELDQSQIYSILHAYIYSKSSRGLLPQEYANFKFQLANSI